MDMMVYYQHLPSFLPFCKKFYAQGPGPCQTFQGGARGKLALAFNPDAVSVFPSRCLLRLLSKPFWTAPLFLLV